MLIHPFTDFIVWLSGQAPVGRQIANAHAWFNVLGVLLFAGLTPWIAQFLEYLIPDAKAKLGTGLGESVGEPSGRAT